MTRATERCGRLAPVEEAALDDVVGGQCDVSGLSAAARSIIGAESGADPHAQNPKSTAFGIGQLTIANRLSILGDDYDTTDCGAQIGAFKRYVAKRYRTDARALAFRQKKGWY